METIKTNTKDFASFFDGLVVEQSDKLIAAAEEKWHGLPVVALELMDGTTARFAVSSWAENTDHDKASMAIARSVIEKDPLVIPSWVAADVTDYDEKTINEVMEKLATDEQKRDFMKGVLDSVGNPDGVIDSAIGKLGIAVFLDKAGYETGEVYEATDGEYWQDTYIRLKETEGGTRKRLDLKGLLDDAVQRSTINRNGLPIVKLPDGKSYIVARNDEERTKVLRAVVDGSIPAVLAVAIGLGEDCISEVLKRIPAKLAESLVEEIFVFARESGLPVGGAVETDCGYTLYAID